MKSDMPDLSALPSRAYEMRVFESRRREWSVAFPREWVAVVGDQLVAHGEALMSVLEQARAAGHDHPFVGRLEDPSLFDAVFIGRA